jgi:phosphoribosylpyrophosphate synthetase
MNENEFLKLTKEINIFKIKQHNSGEYEITLTERIYDRIVYIHWDYFTQKDIMIPMLKAAAIRHTYGDRIQIILDAPYLPYARQDRVFEAGQSIAFIDFTKIIFLNFDVVRTQALHCHNYYAFGKNYINIDRYNLMELQSQYNIVFPDASARHHYYYSDDKMITFNKVRNKFGTPHLELDAFRMPYKIDLYKPFLICDDIGDGNRTFVECAKALRKEFEHSERLNIEIELMVYHQFGTYGFDNLIEEGINKLKIINKDSYNFIVNKYNNISGLEVEQVVFQEGDQE